MLRYVFVLATVVLTLLALPREDRGADAKDARHTLKASEVLTRGEMLRSENGTYELVHQRDGNVVLHRLRQGQAPEVMWQTGTPGRHTTHLIIQPDGNLVLYYQSTALWHSGTFLGQHHLNVSLQLANDGDLVISHDGKRIWTSGTARRDRLRAGERLERGQVLRSPSGEYTLVHRGDGNLVLYRLYGEEGQDVLWQTQTDRQTTTHLIMQHDGNLVLYDQYRPAWYTLEKVRGQQLKVELRLQDDGNLVAYEYGQPFWFTGTVQPPRTVRPPQNGPLVTAKAWRDFGNGHHMNTDVVLNRDKGVLDVRVRLSTNNNVTGFRGKVQLLLTNEKRSRLWPAADAEAVQTTALGVEARTLLTQPSNERHFGFKVPVEDARKARKIWIYPFEEGASLPGGIEEVVKQGKDLHELLNKE